MRLPWKVTKEGIQILWDSETEEVWMHAPEIGTVIMSLGNARFLLTLLKNRGKRKLFCKMLERTIEGTVRK